MHTVLQKTSLCLELLTKLDPQPKGQYEQQDWKYEASKEAR